jgi:hypothetical protein
MKVISEMEKAKHEPVCPSASCIGKTICQLKTEQCLECESTGTSCFIYSKMTIPFGDYPFKTEEARRFYLRELHNASSSASASNFKTTTCSYIVTKSSESLNEKSLEDFITRIDSFKTFPNFYQSLYNNYKHRLTFERDNKQRYIDACAQKISVLEGTIRSFETYISSSKITICQLNQQASDLTFTSELLKNLTPELRLQSSMPTLPSTRPKPLVTMRTAASPTARLVFAS